MTYTVPYTFVPGTKAKADEVNANFIDLIDKLEDTNERITTLSSNKADKTEIDGCWTPSYLKIINGVSLYHADSSNAPFSLASYLPDSTNLYEILVRGTAVTTNVSGSYAPIFIYTDWLSDAHGICSARTRSANTIEAIGSNTILAKSSITLMRKANYAGTATVELLGYRKVR